MPSTWTRRPVMPRWTGRWRRSRRSRRRRAGRRRCAIRRGSIGRRVAPDPRQQKTGEADDVAGEALFVWHGCAAAALFAGAAAGAGVAALDEDVGGQAGAVEADDALAGVQCSAAAGAAVVGSGTVSCTSPDIWHAERAESGGESLGESLGGRLDGL